MAGNGPLGRRYNMAFAELMRADGFGGIDNTLKVSFSCVLWLHEDDHLTILREIQERMTPSQRAHLTPRAN